MQIGDYIILENIGEGGMSVVYLAEDRRDRTQVVVKQLREDLAFDKQMRDRFEQSALIMQQLRHPHLARVLDYIEHDGKYYMVEEYLSGGSLADLLTKGEPFSQEEALRWCRDALQAVNYAHQNSICHRDLKPGNLMLNEKREVKVTDFGIAKVFGGPRLTKTGSEMGTLVYMSPEQIRSPLKVDHLTDVYSMGVVLYELLTRKVPFERDGDFDTKEAVVKEPPPLPRRLNPNIDVKLQQIVLKAMEKRPDDRFGGCGEFALEIDRYLGRRQSGPKPPPIKNPVAWIKNHQRIAAGLFLLLLVGILALQPEGWLTGIVDGTQAPTIELVANPRVIRSGQSTLLQWNVQRAQRVRIEPEIGEVPAIGSQTVAPAKSVTYVATATGAGRTVSETVDITVEPPISPTSPPTVVFVAKPDKIMPGQVVLLEWEAQNADKVRIDPDIGEVSATGRREVNPTTSVTYVATATGPGGTVSNSIDIMVGPLLPTIVFVATPVKIRSGEVVLLEWRAQNADRVRIEPGLGVVPATGRREVAPAKSVSYVATATGAGRTVLKRVDITVEPRVILPPTIAFAARPAKITQGEAIQLEWEAQNADRVRIDPDIGEVAATGRQEVTPTTSVTYVATATGPGGTVSKRIEIKFVEPPPRPVPTIRFLAKPAMIKSGEFSWLLWSTQNADKVRIEPEIGEVAATGRRKVTPTKSGSYIATATGPGGTVSERISILVANGDVKMKKLECKSKDGQKRTCDIRSAVPENATIFGVTFLQQDSRDPCIEGSTYGIDPQAASVWVNQGCGADFRVFYSRP